MLRGIYWILLLFLYIRIVTQAVTAPIDFDEGYNLQISYHVQKNLFDYRTFLTKFDPQITTGPTVLIPASLFINDNVSLLPRIVMVVYAVLFICICLHFIFRTLLQKVIFLFSLNAVPLFPLFSVHILGELPGFVFLILALLLLQKKRFILSGIMLGLSIVTKQVYLFGVIPFIGLLMNTVTLEYTTKKKGLKNRHRFNYLKHVVKMWSFGFFSVFIVWLLYIFTSVGFSSLTMIQILDRYESTMRILATNRPMLLIKRLDMFSYIFSIPGITFALLILCVAFFCMYKMRRTYPLISALAFYVSVYTIFFLFMGSTYWYRHFFPVMLAISIVLPFFITSLLFSKNEKHFIALGIIGVIILINIGLYKLVILRTVSIDHEKRITIEQNLLFTFEQPFFPRLDSRLNGQLHTAAYIKDNIEKKDSIAGIGWWNAPEIQYLARREIKQNPSQKEVTYIITHFYGETLGMYDYLYLKQIPKTLIYKTDGYALYQKH